MSENTATEVKHRWTKVLGIVTEVGWTASITDVDGNTYEVRPTKDAFEDSDGLILILGEEGKLVTVTTPDVAADIQVAEVHLRYDSPDLAPVDERAILTDESAPFDPALDDEAEPEE
jgi:hypothetical protein